MAPSPDGRIVAFATTIAGTEDYTVHFVDVDSELAEQTAHTHVLWNNCYSDYAQRNATELVELLGEGD